ncbi:hypothetical protein T484DRAFT_1781069, partial [Baffinella frigidus]
MSIRTIGDAEAGKTALLAALADPDEKCPTHIIPTISPELSRWTPKGLDPALLTFKVYDLGGSPMYDATNAFFLSPAAVILLVFRVKPASTFKDEDAIAEDAHLSSLRWLTTVHLSAPGATVILVGTHIDCADPPDVALQ